jgi:hypothetical protein
MAPPQRLAYTRVAMDDGVTRSADRRTGELVGRVVAGKFRIESYVGGGAMGAVYKARQVALDKDVAIKVLHGEHAGDATFAARFQREARAASRLDHPNSMRVIDFGQEPDGLLYIAMEFLDGRDLFHVIREDWPLSTRRVADIVSQALAALAVAHEMGIVHRDLKPENIMMLSGTDDEGHTSDVVKVCDFGIAKFTEQREAPATGQKLTSQGIVVGTPEYMSPEQGKGEALDARSDLYAMGVILYQMLTGRVPFDAETAIGVVLKHVTEEPVPPRKINPQADERLEAVCLKAMRKKREDRYASARQMRQELRAVLGGTDPLAHAATQQLASAASLAHAPTAVALDSSKVVAAASASKLTPAGTVTDSGTLRAGRGRTVAVVMVSAAVAAGAFGAWKLRALTSAPPVVAAALVEPAHADPGPPPSVAASAPEAKTAAVPPLDVPPAATSRAPLATPLPAPGRNVGPANPPPGLAAAPPPPTAPSPPPPVSVAVAPAAAVPAPPPVAVAPPPPAAPAPAPAPFDPSHAHVDWSVAGAGGGATPGAVQRALSRRAGSWTQCYRAELGRRNARVEGSASLHLTTDESGNVVGVSVRGFEAMSGVQSCVAAAARVKIDGVDTGDAWADVQLNFKAE